MENEVARVAPPALNLDIDDGKLVAFIDAYVKKSDAFFKERKIDTRSKKNKKYLLGRQYEDKKPKKYQTAYLDNVIKEGEDVLRPLVLSRMPEFVAKAGTDSDESRQTADKITQVINRSIQSREIKKVLTKAFRHHPIYFRAIIKYRWDPNKGRNGDNVFEVIHPDNIKVDHTATENNERAMRIIVHQVEKPIKDWILMFPKKEKEIIKYARSKGAFVGDLTEESMAANLKGDEVWFDWFEKAKEYDPENPKFDFYQGVCWKMGKALLDKKLNPNWDWEGSEELFFNGQLVPADQLERMTALGMDINSIPGLETKKTFRNFFGKPRKPFIFLGYEQYGEMPYDETSRIEENITLQENYDKRGMQITTMIDEARGKHVFSKMSGLKKETLGEMDLNDPDEDIVIDGDLRQVHAFITKEQPSNQMFNDLGRTRERMMSKIHISSPSRGEIASDTATTNQIARESDYNVADDLSDLMINDAAQQMAEAFVHMMKLRYTEDHFKYVLGKDGKPIFEKFINDAIEDGMEIEIIASGTDKLKAERQAKEEAGLKLIDPLTYFKDTGRSDPEGRTEKLFLYNTNPELYYERFVKNKDIAQVAGDVNAMNQDALAGAGVPPQAPPMAPSSQDTTQIPTVPQGSPRGIIGGIKSLFGR